MAEVAERENTELIDYSRTEYRMVAVSKFVAAATKNMNAAQIKTIVYALVSMEPGKNAVRLDKRKLAEYLGIRSTNGNTLSAHIRRAVGNITADSLVVFKPDGKKALKEKGIQFNTSAQSVMVTDFVTRNNDYVLLCFNQNWMPILSNLEAGSFIQLYAKDILLNIRTGRAAILYEQLRLYSDTSKDVCTHTFTVTQLKEMWRIPTTGKGSYRRSDGSFNRTAFETNVLLPVMEDLKNSEMIRIIVNGDDGVEDRYWTKVRVKCKDGSYVIGYRFCYSVVKISIPEQDWKVGEGKKKLTYPDREKRHRRYVQKREEQASGGIGVGLRFVPPEHVDADSYDEMTAQFVGICHALGLQYDDQIETVQRALQESNGTARDIKSCLLIYAEDEKQAEWIYGQIRRCMDGLWTMAKTIEYMERTVTTDDGCEIPMN